MAVKGVYLAHWYQSVLSLLSDLVFSFEPLEVLEAGSITCNLIPHHHPDITRGPEAEWEALYGTGPCLIPALGAMSVHSQVM